MSETGRMTTEEHSQGWYAMACGEHAYVWRASLIAIIPAEAIEI